MDKLKTILVTGGAGFIGGNIANTLWRDGYKVVVFDNLETGTRKALNKKIKFIKGDLRNPAKISLAMKGIDLVIHCAGLISVPESYQRSNDYYATNVSGTYNLLEAMRKHGVKNILFSSTAGVYNPYQPKPLSEKSVTHPYSPYGATKLICEELLKFYHVAHNFNVVIFRYFNAYGPGDYKKNPLNVVPIFIKKIKRGQPLTVHGNGRLVRDYVYISDLVEAHLKAMKLTGFHLFNLGSGLGSTVNDLVKSLSAAFNKPLKIKKIKIPVGYPLDMYADSSLAKKELGWSTKVKLKEGILNTVNFYLNK